MTKLAALTPLVQPLSLDEAWLDLTGADLLHGGPAAQTLARAQREIEQEIGLSVSIGLSANKFLAKIASELDKPRGFAVIGASEAAEFLAPRPVSILPGVGPVAARGLQAAGYSTVGDIAAAAPKVLARQFGVSGMRLAELARGEDRRRIAPDQKRKSISAETTFVDDIAKLPDLEAHLWRLSQRVARQARSAGVAGRVVTLKLRTAAFRLVTRRKVVTPPCQTAKLLFATAGDLLKATMSGDIYRLIGVGLSDLEDVAAGPDDLFAGMDGKVLRAEQTLDALTVRFGPRVVFSARDLK